MTDLFLGRTVKAVPLVGAVKRHYAVRGFLWDNNLTTLVLGLNEEAGEVAAATLDRSTNFVAKEGRVRSDLEHELWDCLKYIGAIAASAGIDLQVFISEEACDQWVGEDEVADQ